MVSWWWAIGLFAVQMAFLAHSSPVIVQDSLDVETMLLDLSELPDGLGERLPQGWKVPSVKAKQNFPLYHKISPSFSKTDQWDPSSFLYHPQDLQTEEDAPASFLFRELSTLFGESPVPQPFQLASHDLNGLLAYLIVQLAAITPLQRPLWAGKSLHVPDWP